MIKSKCCGAKVRYSDFSPDFIGDKPETQRIGTCYYICTKCNQACDIIIPIRKTFKINPKTRVQPNKKKDYKPKIDMGLDFYE